MLVIARALAGFFEKTRLDERFALEVRNSEWFSEEWVSWASGLGTTLVSVDSMDFPLHVFSTSGLVYERMHGRTEWHSHLYFDEELRGVADKILGVKPRGAYVFFNNNHAILVNSRRMLSMLKEIR